MEPMTEREVRLMTSRFGASWVGWRDPQAERALAAALRCFTQAEAEAALGELVEQTLVHPSLVDVVARLEAVRRRGELATSGRVATRGRTAAALLKARRALFLASCHVVPDGETRERQSA